MTQFTKRQLIPEMMDQPEVDREELSEALEFIRRVNRRLGGTAALLTYLKRRSSGWPKDRPIRLLDVGTGSADIPLEVVNWAEQAGHDVQVKAIDFHAVTLELARAHIGDCKAIELYQCDALKLMDQFDPGSFDYAHAGMFLHHLPDIEVMTMLRIMGRLASRAVIWNDLMRSLVGRIGVRLMTFGPRISEMVRHDAVVSVAKGFRKNEVLDLARRAGLPNLHYRGHLHHRFTLISESS